jgi:hypothetical protein
MAYMVDISVNQETIYPRSREEYLLVATVA